MYNPSSVAFGVLGLTGLLGMFMHWLEELWWEVPLTEVYLDKTYEPDGAARFSESKVYGSGPDPAA